MPTLLMRPRTPRGSPPAAASSTVQDISARAEVKSSCERAALGAHASRREALPRHTRDEARAGHLRTG